jgi:hypothetical protein
MQSGRLFIEDNMVFNGSVYSLDNALQIDQIFLGVSLKDSSRSKALTAFDCGTVFALSDVYVGEPNG